MLSTVAAAADILPLPPVADSQILPTETRLAQRLAAVFVGTLPPPPPPLPSPADTDQTPSIQQHPSAPAPASPLPPPPATALEAASERLRIGVGESLRGSGAISLQQYVDARRSAAAQVLVSNDPHYDEGGGGSAAPSGSDDLLSATLSMRPTNGEHSVQAQLAAAAAIGAAFEYENEGEGGGGGGDSGRSVRRPATMVGTAFNAPAEDAAREVYLGILAGAPEGRKARICAEVAPAFRDLSDLLDKETFIQEEVTSTFSDSASSATAYGNSRSSASRVADLTAVVSGVCTYQQRNKPHSDGTIINVEHPDELFTVGREPWNDIVVDCPCISRLHLVCFVYPTRVVLIDGWSKCGTKVAERGDDTAEKPCSMPGSRRAILIPRGEPVTLELGPDARITLNPKPCRICFSQMCAVRYAGCGHLVACEDCHQSMLQQGRNAVYKCPLCGVDVHEHFIGRGAGGSRSRNSIGGVLRGDSARVAGSTFVGADLAELQRLIDETAAASRRNELGASPPPPPPLPSAGRGGGGGRRRNEGRGGHCGCRYDEQCYRCRFTAVSER